MKLSLCFIILSFIISACNNAGKNDNHYQALEKEWKKHLRPADSVINVLPLGKTFALESSETQGIDHERFKEFDFTKEINPEYFEFIDSKNFSNPEEAGGSLFTLEIFKAIKKGETEVRFYKKHYYGNRDPQDTSYVKDTTRYLYNTYKFRIE
jgi:hypothetical protein